MSVYFCITLEIRILRGGAACCVILGFTACGTTQVHVQDSSCSEEPIEVKELLIMKFQKILIFFNKAFLWNT